jgi:hypothetical protein
LNSIFGETNLKENKYYLLNLTNDILIPVFDIPASREIFSSILNKLMNSEKKSLSSNVFEADEKIYFYKASKIFRKSGTEITDEVRGYMIFEFNILPDLEFYNENEIKLVTYESIVNKDLISLKDIPINNSFSIAPYGKDKVYITNYKFSDIELYIFSKIEKVNYKIFFYLTILSLLLILLTIIIINKENKSNI